MDLEHDLLTIGSVEAAARMRGPSIAAKDRPPTPVYGYEMPLS